ncbi:MAG: hypothetical protein NTV34_06320 [Proteobacteria bacterium]|nr:hypothetical protein [Pseudomonadota bacterium]
MRTHGWMLNQSLSGKWAVTALMSALFGSHVTLAKGYHLAAEEVIGDDGYNKTYNDESKSFKDRMKESRETPVMTASNEKGGFFLGVNGMFGPVYDAEPKSTSGMGFGAGVEPGFVIQGDSWSRIEIGVQVAYNSFAWKVKSDDGAANATMAPMTILPRIGWGSSLGNNIYGVVKLGFGFGMAKLDLKDGGDTSSTPSTSGFLLSGDYDVTYGAGKMQFTGGIGAVHHKYAWASIKSGNKEDKDVLPTNLNFVNLHGGVRIQL